MLSPNCSTNHSAAILTIVNCPKPPSLVTSSSIEWKGIKFMFENKKYAKSTVSKPEVDKAVRDFNAKMQTVIN
jgi:hypothetical protein